MEAIASLFVFRIQSSTFSEAIPNTKVLRESKACTIMGAINSTARGLAAQTNASSRH
jgi:hypothetical protein